jgi:SAM-dependent methyltransferase
MRAYTKEFYQSVLSGSTSSAREIVPLIFELIQPHRVIDVGCGTGDWLQVFREFGVEEILGIDGDWVDISELRIPADCFRVVDLTSGFSVEGQFDLVISLEVGEHIASESADAFVGSLSCLGPVILFSAAIPHQGGTNHFNEQWPDYWVQLFQMKGYVAIDCIRKRVWNNEKVEWWYAQNIILFVKEDYLESQPRLKKEHTLCRDNQLSIVHPRLYLDKVRRTRPGVVLHVALAEAKDAMKYNITYLLSRIGLQKR